MTSRQTAHLTRQCLVALLAISSVAAQDPPAKPLINAKEWNRGFVENVGQWQSAARFVARAGGLTITSEREALVLQAESGRHGVVARLDFEGADSAVSVDGEGVLPGVRHYLLGSDGADWKRNVPAFFGVRWSGLYPGIDIQMQATGAGLELVVTVASGVDLDDLVLRCGGIDGLESTADGALLLRTAAGTLRCTPVRTWEGSAGGGRPITGSYGLLNGDRVSFRAPMRDLSQPLTIQAGLEWATYVGGSGFDYLRDVVAGPAGEIVLVGDTTSVDFPVSAGAYDVTLADNRDAFVLSLDPSGSHLNFGTYLGGALDDRAVCAALDTNGVITISGWTSNADFPVTVGAFDRTHNGLDMFVTRLVPDGSDLVFSTFLGGSSSEVPAEIVLATGNEVIVAGSTSSIDYPVTARAFQQTQLGTGDGFITRLSGDGSTLVWSTRLGGSLNDSIRSLALMDGEEVLVCGNCGNAPDFPFTPGTYQPGGDSAFVARLASDGGSIIAATSFGGTVPINGGETPRVVRLDPSGNIVVVGHTTQANFPTTPGVFQPQPSPSGLGVFDGFIICFDPLLTGLVYSTYFGGAGFDHILDLKFDGAGAVLVSGTTRPGNFPTTLGCLDSHPDGPDVFVSRLSPNCQALWYSTLLGGSDTEEHLGEPANYTPLILSPEGGAVVGHYTLSPDYPVTPGAFLTDFPGGGDIGLANLTLLPTGCVRYGTPTLGSKGEPAIGVTAMPQVGSNKFGLTCGPVPPMSGQGLLVLGLGSLQQPVSAGGAALWIDLSAFTVIVPVASNEIGACVLRLAIPPSAAIEGLTGYAQFLWKESGLPNGHLAASRGLAFTIQP